MKLHFEPDLDYQKLAIGSWIVDLFRAARKSTEQSSPSPADR